MKLNELRLRNDLILVKPITTYNEGGLIFIPETIESKHAHKPGDSEDTFTGVVVATGPGDKLLHIECRACGHQDRSLADRAAKRAKGSGRYAFLNCKCGLNNWRLTGESRAKMQTKVGDKVVFARRPNTPGGYDGMMIEGERYLLFNEEQSALMVIGKADRAEASAA